MGQYYFLAGVYRRLSSVVVVVCKTAGRVGGRTADTSRRASRATSR